MIRIQTLLLLNLLICVWTLPVNLTRKNETDDQDTKLLEVSKGLLFAEKMLRLRFWMELSHNSNKTLLYQVFGNIYHFIHYKSKMQKEEIVNQGDSVSSGVKAILTTGDSVSSGVKAILTTMVEQACKWMKYTRPNGSFNCSKNEWEDLYMMQKAQEFSRLTYITLKDFTKLRNVDSNEWFKANILCRDKLVSPDVLRYIATYGEQMMDTSCS